ncbi:hypothetical protein [Actinomadura rugatobispora]|uniref:XapX domain-containing protein n=1 Tax=Actinomadura rugatobispora TaxID=1994 RepID=A0ABW0ZWF8_9ACTN|nr:hypothetical protein GCM10010200_065780 [Actinomadura rugatobispora]
MRAVGAVLLGFIAGLFAGFALELLAAGVGRLVVDAPGLPAPLPVALAVTGGVAALVADRRARRRERR